MIALLLLLACSANALDIKAPSPNTGTITPSAITTGVGSFSGSVTASSVTATKAAIGTTMELATDLDPLKVSATDGYTRGLGIKWGPNSHLYGGRLTYDQNSGNTQIDNSYDNAAARMDFRMRTQGTAVTAMSILGSGSVGIGTSAPESANKLQVQAATGNVVVASSTTASGFGVFSAHGTAGGCIMLTDTDNAGWTKCKALNGTLTCATDSDGICD